MSAGPAFTLRGATRTDFDFARGMYICAMEPLLRALDAWDADEIDTAFEGYFIPAEIKIVQVQGVDIGWFQVSETDTDLFLDQLYLMEHMRGQGIGTALIRGVISDATARRKNVSLSLIRDNPAIHLYRRLGFRITSQDETKFHMQLETAQP